jgi:cytochrome P450
VVAWSAGKEGAAAAAPAEGALPEWLVSTDRPVPQSEHFKVQAAATRIHAYLMALIDGRRSVRDIARMFVEQRLLSEQDAEPAVRRFLIRMSEDSRKSGM